MKYIFLFTAIALIIGCSHPGKEKIAAYDVQLDSTYRIWRIFVNDTGGVELKTWRHFSGSWFSEEVDTVLTPYYVGGKNPTFRLRNNKGRGFKLDPKIRYDSIFIDGENRILLSEYPSDSGINIRGASGRLIISSDTIRIHDTIYRTKETNIHHVNTLIEQ